MLQEIQKKVADGISVNQTDAYGTGMLFSFLENYYLTNWACEDDLPTPPQEIQEALQWFLDAGADLNLGRFLFPLTLAVGRLDLFMTKWLLDHGADPSVCPEDEVNEPNYCLFMLGNCRYLSLKEGRYTPEKEERVCSLLSLLHAHGVRGSWQGITLDEKGVSIK